MLSPPVSPDDGIPMANKEPPPPPIGEEEFSMISQYRYTGRHGQPLQVPIVIAAAQAATPDSQDLYGDFFADLLNDEPLAPAPKSLSTADSLPAPTASIAYSSESDSTPPLTSNTKRPGGLIASLRQYLPVLRSEDRPGAPAARTGTMVTGVEPDDNELSMDLFPVWGFTSASVDASPTPSYNSPLASARQRAESSPARRVVATTKPAAIAFAPTSPRTAQIEDTHRDRQTTVVAEEGVEELDRGYAPTAIPPHRRWVPSMMKAHTLSPPNADGMQQQQISAPVPLSAWDVSCAREGRSLLGSLRDDPFSDDDSPLLPRGSLVPVGVRCGSSSGKCSAYRRELSLSSSEAGSRLTSPPPPSTTTIVPTLPNGTTAEKGNARSISTILALAKPQATPIDLLQRHKGAVGAHPSASGGEDDVEDDDGESIAVDVSSSVPTAHRRDQLSVIHGDHHHHHSNALQTGHDPYADVPVPAPPTTRWELASSPLNTARSVRPSNREDPHSNSSGPTENSPRGRPTRGDLPFPPQTPIGRLASNTADEQSQCKPPLVNGPTSGEAKTTAKRASRTKNAERKLPNLTPPPQQQQLQQQQQRPLLSSTAAASPRSAPHYNLPAVCSKFLPTKRS